jgi:hypothetical protein
MLKKVAENPGKRLYTQCLLRTLSLHGANGANGATGAVHNTRREEPSAHALATNGANQGLVAARHQKSVQPVCCREASAMGSPPSVSARTRWRLLRSQAPSQLYDTRGCADTASD